MSIIYSIQSYTNIIIYANFAEVILCILNIFYE